MRIRRSGKRKPGPAAVKLEACVSWLRDRLATGPASLSEIRHDAALAGFSAKTLYRAKDALGVGDDLWDGRRWWSVSPAQREALGVVPVPVASGSAVHDPAASREMEPAQRTTVDDAPIVPDPDSHDSEPAQRPSPGDVRVAPAVPANGEPEPAQPARRPGDGPASVVVDGVGDRAEASESDSVPRRRPGDARLGKPLIVCRGESDRLLLDDHLGGFADVMAVGDGAGEPSREVLRAAGLASAVYLAHDNDETGGRAASPWPSSAIRVRPPERDWRETHEKHPGMIGYVWGRYLPLGSPPMPEDFFDPALHAMPPDDHDVAEAQAERRAIQEADGIFDGPEPTMSPSAWLREFNSSTGRPNPPEAAEVERLGPLEAETVERIGPSLPSGGFEPEADDEAARLALFIKDRPEPIGEVETDVETVVRILGTAGFVRVDPVELDRLAEFDPPRAQPAPVLVATTPERPRPMRRAGRVAERTLF